MLWRAGTHWESLAGTDRQLVDALSHAVDVWWIDPPRSVASWRPGKPLLPRVDRTADGVLRLALSAPPMSQRRWMAPVTEALVRAMVRWVVRVEHRTVAAVVSTTPFASMNLAGASSRVYYATDDFTAGAQLLGREVGYLHELESRRLAESTAAGGVSALITQRWPAATDAFVLPNGANTAHYGAVDQAPLPTDVVRHGPVAGVIGHLSARIDLDLLEAVAATSITLLLVGPRVDGWGGDRFDALVRRHNVTWVGHKSYAELPSYLRVMDVGLTPYVDSDFNRASSPLKTMEYLAAGRPALSTPLPAVTALGTDLVTCASSPAEFAAAAERLARAPRDPTLERARRDYASTHDWQSRARELLTILDLEAAADGRPHGRRGRAAGALGDASARRCGKAPTTYGAPEN